MKELFPNGVPRNWRSVLKAAGIDSSGFTRQGLWDLMNPDKLVCSCGAPKPVKQTNIGRLETCGSDICRNALKSARTEKTSLERYGTKRPMQSAAVQAKQAATFEKHYGGHPTKTASVQEKRGKTNLARYGVLTPAIEQTRIEKSVQSRKRSAHDRYVTEVWPHRVKFFAEHLAIDTLSEFVSIKHSLKFKHLTCGTEWEGFIKPSPICPKCSLSREQAGIFEFAKSLGVDVRLNTRSVIAPYELDVFFPDKKLGIELNGSYWHRDGNGTPIHRKTELAAEAGIRLIHVADHEWNEHADIVKSHVVHALDLTKIHVNARSCTVQYIKPAISKAFLIQTHLQGAINASFHLGLFHDSVLVAVMTLGKPRWGDRSGLEILRWSTMLNTSVRGGFSKVLSFVKHQLKPTRIISYCDRRYGTGSVYEAAGFKYLGDTKPGYIWFKGRARLNRWQTQKHLLPALLGEQFKVGLSEIENMEAAGWFRLFDAGHQRWELVI